MEIDFRVHPSGEYLMLSIKAPIPLPGEVNPEEIIITKVAIQSFVNYTTEYPKEPDFEFEVNDSYYASRISMKPFINQTGLYYLYVQTSSEGNKCPCAGFPTAVAIDLHPLYNLTINSFRKMDCNSCDSREYDRVIDLIVKHEVLERAIKIKDFSTANQLWCNIIGYDWKRGRCRDSFYSQYRGLTCDNCN